MSNKEKFQQFLIDDTKERFIYIDDQYSYNSNHYYKEKYNDRFYLLYERRFYDNKMEKTAYDFAGFYDSIDKVLYNPSYDIRQNIFKDVKSVIQFSSLETIDEQMSKDLTNYFCDYAIKHLEEFKNKYREEFGKLEDYRIKNYQKDVEKQFVLTDNIDNIPLCDYNSYYIFKESNDYSNTSIYTNYLDNSEKEIEKIALEILEKHSEEIEKNLAMNLLENEYKNHYLSLIKNNTGKMFDYVYTNKVLLSSIKEIEAVNLNITIEYDKEQITFKFPKDRLMRELEDIDLQTCNYGKDYEKVEEFLKNHKSKDEWYRTSFDFKNIVSITYGKNILFDRNDIKEQLVEDLEEEIEI